MKIKIRRLKVSDGEISWKWRNDPEVWKLTGRKWFGKVSEPTEKDWIKEVIKRENEARFAICVGDDEQYIGNVQLTNIENGQAEFHIFIGEKSFWGKGIGNEATRLMVDYGFNQMGLSKIYLFVREENIPAIKAYKNCGFKIVSKNMEGALKMEVRKS
jgi:RimJ/RimL family protein N-acetyltransferase